MAATPPPIPSNQGLSPLDELTQWKKWRDSVDPSTLTDPQAVQYYNGPSPRPNDPRFPANPLFSAGASDAFVNAKTHFDTTTGQTSKNKGFMDLPESKWILAMAAGAGAGIAAPAIAGALGSSGALSGAAPEIATTSAGPITGLAAPTAAGLSTAGAAGATTAGTAGVSTLGKVAGLLKGKAGSDILGAAGAGLGDAANAAGNNRLTQAQLALMNEGANTTAQSAYETEMLNRAKEEQSQRNDALKQQYYANYVQNRTPGPFNTAGITKYGPDVTGTVADLAAQAKAKLANAPQYDTNGMPVLKSTAIDPATFMQQYGQQGTLEKTANWLSPTLSTLSRVARYF